MIKKIKKEENGDAKLTLIMGFRKSKTSDTTNNNIYKELLFTDGEIVESNTISLDREQIQKEYTELLSNYQNIEEVEITQVRLKNPTYYIIMSIAEKKEKSERHYVLEDIEEYAIKPYNEDIMDNIKKTYEDINSLILSGDVKLFEYFLGKNKVFRLNYCEVSNNIYQLKKGKIK